MGCITKALRSKVRSLVAEPCSKKHGGADQLLFFFWTPHALGGGFLRVLHCHFNCWRNKTKPGKTGTNELAARHPTRDERLQRRRRAGVVAGKRATAALHQYTYYIGSMLVNFLSNSILLRCHINPLFLHEKKLPIKIHIKFGYCERGSSTCTRLRVACL